MREWWNCLRSMPQYGHLGYLAMSSTCGCGSAAVLGMNCAGVPSPAHADWALALPAAARPMLARTDILRASLRSMVCSFGGGAGTGRRGSLRLWQRSEEQTSELQSREMLVCRLLLVKK